MEEQEKTMNVVGIICARVGSERLPNKNILEMNDDGNLIQIAYNKLRNCNIETYVVTDYKIDGVKTYERPAEHEAGDMPLQDTVDWFLKHHKIKADIVVVLMPTNPFILEENIKLAVEKVKEGSCVCRTYDIDGNENGLYVINRDYWKNNAFAYDVYTTSLFNPGHEIHTEEDYEDALELWAVRC